MDYNKPESKALVEQSTAFPQVFIPMSPGPKDENNGHLDNCTWTIRFTI